MRVTTVEGLAPERGVMTKIQDAFCEKHALQCGYCTPGFVVSMAVAHLNGARDHDDQLAGNLCRCTGYAPIVRAAEAAARQACADAGGVAEAEGDPRGKRNHYTKPKVKGRLSKRRAE